MAQTFLILGGARSGKSRHARRLAEASGLSAVMIATAQAGDDLEMTDRIARHRAERSNEWRTIEAAFDLAGAIDANTNADHIVVVDCLTLWLANVMMAERDVEADVAALCDAIRRCRGSLILVSNEVGSGIVPDNALGRRFRDAQGWLNQDVASICSDVALVVAGIAMSVKSSAL